MNLDRYKFDNEDLIVAAAVNGYLKKMKPEAREDVLAGIVKEEGAETVINGPALVTSKLGPFAPVSMLLM